MIRWAFFAASVLASAFVTTSFMEMVRLRVHRLAELSEAVSILNNRLRSLHRISNSIVASRRLQTVLDMVCRELAAVLGVQGVSVKLLSEDATRLRYVASQGLPARFAPGEGAGGRPLPAEQAHHRRGTVCHGPRHPDRIVPARRGVRVGTRPVSASCRCVTRRR